MDATRFGRYELIRRLGMGGMAEIFLARFWGADGFSRDLVVKRLFKHLADNERTLRMFQDEARLMSELSHPNIPQVYELGFAQGQWFIALEYVDGFNLADLVRMSTRAKLEVPLPVAVGIIRQISEALHHAHERSDRNGRALGIVHRDVTPHNVMLTSDGVVKLLDFGVAKSVVHHDTDVRAVKGTFSYMAPEQVLGRPLDRRADVFAIGILLYELTTASRLFDGNNVEVMTSIVERDSSPPSRRIPGYPADLEAIVQTALRRDREGRTASAALLVEQLDEFALRHGLLAGPRPIAKFVEALTRAVGSARQTSDVPRTPPPHAYAWVEEELGAFVRSQFDDSTTVTNAKAQAGREPLVPDHDALSEDLGELMRPAARHPAAGGRERADAENEVEGDLDDLLSRLDALDVDDRTQKTTASSSEEELAIEEFDIEPSETPIVLLRSPKRRRVASSGEAAFVRDLERRLEEDPKNDPKKRR